MRAGLKTFSNWPTYPQVPALRARLPSSPLRRRRAAEPPSRSCRAQVYAAGELIGGLDVLNELAEEDGALAEALDLNQLHAAARPGGASGTRALLRSGKDLSVWGLVNLSTRRFPD